MLSGSCSRKIAACNYQSSRPNCANIIFLDDTRVCVLCSCREIRTAVIRKLLRTSKDVNCALRLPDVEDCHLSSPKALLRTTLTCTQFSESVLQGSEGHGPPLSRFFPKQAWLKKLSRRKFQQTGALGGTLNLALINTVTDFLNQERFVQVSQLGS